MFSKISYKILGICCFLVGVFIAPACALEEADIASVQRLRKFVDAYNRIRFDYIEPVDEDKLIEAAISGMVSGIDPMGAFLDEADFHALQHGFDEAGIGLEIEFRAGKYRIISPLEDAPAYRAGIKAGDSLLQVDGKEVSSMPLKGLLALLRGKAGSPLEIAVEREGVAQPLSFQMKREVIHVQTVRSKLLESGYGYARIAQFHSDTGRRLVDALKALYLKNGKPLDGLILDMRSNPGGLLTSAIAVAAIFLPENVLVATTDGRSWDASMRLTTSKESWLRKGEAEFGRDMPPGVRQVPLLVLVNRGSAAGAEIVAGALQDHQRAVICGENTFGKSTLATIFPLSGETAIKITTGYWRRPNGERITERGITPDVELPPKLSTVAVSDEQLSKQAIDLLKAMKASVP